MGRFMKFEKMITPVFIQIIFWVGFLGSLLGGIGQIGFGFFAEQGKVLMILSGLGMMFLGPIIIRIYCEMLIVVFKMQGALVDIRDELRKGPVAQQPPMQRRVDTSVEPVTMD